MLKITIIFLALIKCETDILLSFFKLYAKDNFLYLEEENMELSPGENKNVSLSRTV